MDASTFLSSVFLLTMVMDPLGNIPMFISALKDVPPQRKRIVITRELLFALGLMLFFLLFGKYIVSLLQMDSTAMSVAGGIVLFLIALQMIFPSPHNTLSECPDDEPFIVPLAIPYVAGPSTLSMILLLPMQRPGQPWMLLGVVALAWFICAIILGGLSAPLSRLLGRRGLLAMEKLMGMILITISVQMVMTGLKKFLG